MTHEEAVSTLASERYLLEEMPEDDRDAFEEHFFECGLCAEDVKLGAAMRLGSASVFAGSTRPKLLQWRPAIVLPYAAAALLAVALGYQTAVVVPGLRQAPALVAPVVLRPASRGQEAGVQPGASGAPTVLAVEVELPAAIDAVDYVIVGPRGDSVASGRTPAPPAGAPLYLVLPAHAPAGQYVLRLRIGAAPSNTEYRFVVK